MALKITCPKCSNPNRLTEPYPLSGGIVQCSSCSFSLTITYPEKTLEKLKAKGVKFQPEKIPAPTIIKEQASKSIEKETPQETQPTAYRPPPPPEQDVPSEEPEEEKPNTEPKPKKKRKSYKTVKY